MKGKIILLLSILILVIFLTGCTGGVVTPATDEAKIKSVIQEYYLALNDQNWNKAKNYCIYGSDKYYKTCTIEDAINTLNLYCNIVTVNCFVTISIDFKSKLSVRIDLNLLLNSSILDNCLSSFFAL